MKWLAAFESIYHFLSGSKNILYDSRILNSVELPVPVVSIGNLSFGGVGKTPCIIMLAQRFAKDKKVAVVTKSYKTDLKTPARVDLQIENSTAIFGDEACLIKSKLPQCYVWSGPSKADSAVASMADRPDLILIDDGFSHRKLKRNFDLVLIDATEGFETYLRESAGNLKRASAVLVTKVNIANSIDVEKILKRINEESIHLKNNVFFSSVKTTLSLPKSDPLFVFCGLGRPETFINDLNKQGYVVIEKEFFPDHHEYSAKDQNRIYARYLDAKNQHRDLKLVTTEKDLVKLKNLDLLKACHVTEHSMQMESDLEEVLIAKIRKSL
jgi:tetraacyldisaccharide 4'-kinase